MPRRDFSVSPLERQFIGLRVGQTDSLRELNPTTQGEMPWACPVGFHARRYKRVARFPEAIVAASVRLHVARPWHLQMVGLKFQRPLVCPTLQFIPPSGSIHISERPRVSYN